MEAAHAEQMTILDGLRAPPGGVPEENVPKKPQYLFLVVE